MLSDVKKLYFTSFIDYVIIYLKYYNTSNLILIKYIKKSFFNLVPSFKFINHNSLSSNKTPN